ncbi:MAG: SDR family oxidoreductase [Candidatus Kariarchaeaceae archaeon]|jgi:short-subunit dehydrogenase
MGKVVLITGASSGIGQITAQYLHDQGHTVYGTSRSAHDNFDYKMLILDVTSDDSASSCIDEVLKSEERIDVLVNNAGIGVVGDLAEASVEDIHAQFNTNLYGAHRMVQAVLPHFRENGGGMIINLGSFGGRLAVPYQSLYSASKAALAFYSDGLRMELMRESIVVSCIEPGDTRTPFDTRRKEVSNYSRSEVSERALDIMRHAEANGTDPSKIAKRISKLVNSGKAKPRYTTGIDAKIVGLLLRLVPFSIQERGIMMNYKIPRK